MAELDHGLVQLCCRFSTFWFTLDVDVQSTEADFLVPDWGIKSTLA